MGQINGVAENILLNTQVVDYVVEQGTSGIWTYRKWNSGLAECWANNVNVNAAYGDNQTLSAKNYIALPFPITLATRQCMITATGASWKLLQYYDKWFEGNDNQLCIVCYTQSGVLTATDQYINISVTGRWKEISVDGEIE